MSARSPSPAVAAANTAEPEVALSPTPAPAPTTTTTTAAAAEPEDFIEAETNDANNNDDFSDGYETDTRSSASDSLASSVRDYVFENNRRYHRFKEGRYLIPNDDIEQEREDMKHTMVLHVCNGKLHFSPLDHPQKVLDLGTGTGIWAIDMGDEYPSAEVIGIDLSPIQPSFVPPNVKFYVDDVESTWVDPPESVDYIHARHICMAIKNWPALLQQAYSTLKPGGWIELQELRMQVACDDGTMTEEYQFDQFLKKLVEGYACFNIDLMAMEKSKQLLEDGGFVNVQEKVFKIPVGAWAKDPKMKTVGMYNRSVVSDALQAVSMGSFCRGLHWTPEEVESYLVGVRKSLADTSVHSYLTFHVYFGQKPTSS